MAATACYSQVARALVLRYRSKLILYLLSACLLLPSSRPSVLVGFNGREEGGWVMYWLPAHPSEIQTTLTSHVCECQQWLSMTSLDELQDLSLLFRLPRLSVPFGNNKLHPRGKALEQDGWSGHLMRVRGCVLGCSRKPARAEQLLPASSALITEWACVCKWLTSESRILKPSWFSIQLRALVFLVLDSRAGMPRLEIWTPHSPRGAIYGPKSSHSSSVLLPTEHRS